MNHVGRITLLALLTVGSAGAFADDPARLGKDDVQKALEGKTMVYVASNGSPLRVYYSADGKLTGRGQGQGKSSQSAGEWKIEDDGKVCVVIKQGSMGDRCFYVMRADAALSMTYGARGNSIPITIE